MIIYLEDLPPEVRAMIESGNDGFMDVSDYDCGPDFPEIVETLQKFIRHYIGWLEDWADETDDRKQRRQMRAVISVYQNLLVDLDAWEGPGFGPKLVVS